MSTRKRSAVAENASLQSKENAKYVLDEQVGFLMRKAQQRHIAIFQQTIGPGGPTPTQFAALSRLAASKEISQNQLGRLTAMDPATIKGVITRLAERGLVERLPDPNDQRRVLIRLSDQGRALMPELFARAAAITAATLQPLTEKEAQQLSLLLAKLC
ncbi:DNA-binding MarR family transcriptional regulator [Bosea sp. OAE752]|jgi:DNA-binding MarR family transcriptional regulator|uniref:MarR family transcriptional regulator n=1 Tax=Bosea spartocytisi TaxID=2773451 RepID=A0A927E9Q3_9HYPH|nr:MarR family transcriptional regulator [Bosea spartocytisi]MBD3846532.1 MarR family transcriptional regulator [Bosea spartocytisi]MCT4472077.1 MarR family transcriptional regulator [Bosea spartocytisi]